MGEMLTRWLWIALGGGVAAFVAAFVPSPLQVMSLFDKAETVEVANPPKLAIREMPASAAFEEIVARPLFNDGRKADPETRSVGSVQSGVPAQGGDLSEFRLVGLVIDSVTQRAIVERAGAGTVRVGPGDSLAGWRIEKIDTSGITARKDSQSVRIVMAKPQTRPAAP
jgi:hypothetical protein